MRSKCKNLMIGALIACSLLFTSAKEAEAGIFVGTAIGISCTVNEANNCWIFPTSAILLIGGAILILSSHPMGMARSAATAMIFLDADESQYESQLAQALSMSFPFIDNDEVLSNLAQKMKEKLGKEEMTLVSLNETETKQILQPADLTAEQIQVVVNKLK